MKSIFHIIPHLGGGVGRVLMNFIQESCKHEDNGFRHQIICFEYANDSDKQWGENVGVKIWDKILPGNPQLSNFLCQADVVHIHFWNHPLTYGFFSTQDLPKFRAVIWAHVNGHAAPQILTKAVLKYPDIFVFSTEYSKEISFINDFDDSLNEERLRTVFSSSGFEHVRHVISVPHEGFNVGYIGTVDFCKIHRDFIRICNCVEIPDVKFIVCGGDEHERLRCEAKSLNAIGRFDIKGPVEDICSELAVFDVFGYPLTKGHYGTGEQVLIEAMATGVTPVVIDNGPERYVVEHDQTGIVAKTEAEYVSALEYLYRRPDERKRLSDNALKFAYGHFNISKTTDAWHEIYEEVIARPKSRHFISTSDVYDNGTSMFLMSLGDTKEANTYRIAMASAGGDEKSLQNEIIKSLSTLPPIFYSSTRGSVFHYYGFWKESKGLSYLAGLTKKAKNQQ